jgi:hypothetical protein
MIFRDRNTAAYLNQVWDSGEERPTLSDTIGFKPMEFQFQPDNDANFRHYQDRI